MEYREDFKEVLAEASLEQVATTLLVVDEWRKYQQTALAETYPEANAIKWYPKDTDTGSASYVDIYWKDIGQFHIKEDYCIVYTIDFYNHLNQPIYIKIKESTGSENENENESEDEKERESEAMKLNQTKLKRVITYFLHLIDITAVRRQHKDSHDDF